MRSIRLLGLAALVALTAHCGGGGDSTPSVVPGFLTLTLTTPNANDGALLFKVQGGTVDSVTANPAMVQNGSYVINSGFTRVVVAGNITNGIVVQVHVPDVGKVANYSVTIEQVAVRNTFAQRSPSGYSIAVTH